MRVVGVALFASTTRLAGRVVETSSKLAPETTPSSGADRLLVQLFELPSKIGSPARAIEHRLID